MDENVWSWVCAAYGLGALNETPQAVSGGLQHRLYRIDTTLGAYAVKVLNPLLLAQLGRREQYERAEQIALTAARSGLPAVSALSGPEGPLLIADDIAVMVFPWHSGTVLSATPTPPVAACQIGGLLGRLHALRLTMPERAPSAPSRHPDSHWLALVAQAQRERVSWADPVADALPELLGWNHAAHSALQALGPDTVWTHRDMDQKNVLWEDPQTPWLLDWEDAGPMHPMLELMGTALNWAGQAAGPPHKETFSAFLRGYHDAGVIDHDALSHAAVAVLDKWLVWLEFNMRRSLVDFGALPEERFLACGSVTHSLATLKTLAADTDTRPQWCAAALPHT